MSFSVSQGGFFGGTALALLLHVTAELHIRAAVVCSQQVISRAKVGWGRLCKRGWGAALGEPLAQALRCTGTSQPITGFLAQKGCALVRNTFKGGLLALFTSFLRD